MIDLSDPKRAAKSASALSLRWNKPKTFCEVLCAPGRVMLLRSASVDIVAADTGDEIAKIKLKVDPWLRNGELWAMTSAGLDVLAAKTGKQLRAVAFAKPKPPKGVRLGGTFRG